MSKDYQRLDGEEKFWLSIWCAVIGAFVVLILAVLANSYNDNTTMEAMVKAGANPVAARCALTGSLSAPEAAMCAAYAAAPKQ